MSRPINTDTLIDVLYCAGLVALIVFGIIAFILMEAA